MYQQYQASNSKHSARLHEIRNRNFEVINELQHVKGAVCSRNKTGSEVTE